MADPDAWSTQERRVAELVAGGATNRLTPPLCQATRRRKTEEDEDLLGVRDLERSIKTPSTRLPRRACLPSRICSEAARLLDDHLRRAGGGARPEESR